MQGFLLQMWARWGNSCGTPVIGPTGPFEDDPNLTNKRFPGNPTKSYRTREPLRIIGEVEDWESHPPEVLQSMRDHLAEMERQGLAAIDD